MANVSVCDVAAYHLLIDLELLYEMAKEMTETDGKGDSRGYHALYTGNRMINSIQAGDLRYVFDDICITFVLLKLISKLICREAQRASNEFFQRRNGQNAHTIDAMGHCHIDTAWLWPYDETIRKCARSWSSVIALMKDYPDMTFVCSQVTFFII